jgi:type IV pilus assembly protein PilO
VALKTGLEGKPWYYGLVAGLFVGAGLFGLGHWQYFGPMKDQIRGQDAKLAELANKIQEGRHAQQELPRFREEVRQLELELDKLLRILPAKRNTPDLLRRIRALTEQGDFTLKRFTPGTLTDLEFYSEWPIAIDLDGGYHNLAMLFDRVSRFSRIINIEDLNIIAKPPGSPNTISATFVAKTFVYKEETPAAAPGTPPAPGAAAPPAEASGPAAAIRSGAASTDAGGPPQ